MSGCEVCIEDEILLVDLVELRECLNDGLMFSISEAGGMIAHVQVRSSLVEEVKQLQHDGILWLQDRLVVPVVGDLHRRLLEVANR